MFYFRVSHLAPPDRREVSSYIEKLRLAAGMVKKTDGSSVKTAMRLRDDLMADPSTAAEGKRLNVTMSLNLRLEQTCSNR